MKDLSQTFSNSKHILAGVYSIPTCKLMLQHGYSGLMLMGSLLLPFKNDSQLSKQSVPIFLPSHVLWQVLGFYATSCFLEPLHWFACFLNGAKDRVPGNRESDLGFPLFTRQCASQCHRQWIMNLFMLWCVRFFEGTARICDRQIVLLSRPYASAALFSGVAFCPRSTNEALGPSVTRGKQGGTGCG